MSSADLTFVAAPSLAAVAYVLAVLAVAALPTGRTQVVHLLFLGGLTVVIVFAVAATAWWWGVGFDEAERLGVARAKTDRAMAVSLVVAVAALAGIVMTGATAVLARRPPLTAWLTG